MATAYSSVEYTLNPSPRFNEKGVYTVYAHFALSAALIINDTIAMFKLPANARVLDMELSTDDLDSNVSPLITLDVGDATTADRFIAAAVVGKTGGTISMKDATYGTRAGFAYRYTADTPILVKVKAAPATGTTSGTIKLLATVAVDD